MAEHVQYRLEETLGELEQMGKVGLFQNHEIRKITKRRRELLYKLQRRTKSKENFLDYIEYEINLLKLIKIRRNQLRILGRRNDIDYTIATRINRVYKEAIFRYQSDVSLWLKHISFLQKMGWNESISRMFSRMLQVHGDKAKIWIYAASWEIMHNNAAESARTIMLKALRFHPKSKELYLEYFHIELLYADRIRKRREILGMADETDDNAADAIIQGKVAYVVFKNAMENINDVDYLLSFLPICKKFDFTEELQDEIFRDIQDRYTTDESMWNYLARSHLVENQSHLSKLIKETDLPLGGVLKKSCDDCFDIFKTAVEVIPTEKMWTLYIQTCLDGFKEKCPKIYCTKEIGELCLKEALNAMTQASSQMLLAKNLYLEWVSLLQENDMSDIDSVLLSAVEQYQGSAVLWKSRLETMIKEGASHSGIHKAFNEAINAVNEVEALPIWHMAIQWSRITSPEKVLGLYELAMKSCKEISVPLKPLYLEYCALYQGANDARKLYERIRYQSPICIEFFYKMMKIEAAQLNPNIERQRRIMEDIIEHFGKKDIKPWLDYINLEKTHPMGQPLNISKIHWRAIKVLDPELEARFTTAFALTTTK